MNGVLVMEISNVYKEKMKERLGIEEEIEFLAYGEVSKKHNNIIKVASNERYGGKFCMVTVVNGRIYSLILDKEANIGRVLILDSKNMKKIKFKEYLLGLGRKMYLESDKGETLEIKFIKKVGGIKNQKESIKYIEDSLSKNRILKTKQNA